MNDLSARAMKMLSTEKPLQLVGKTRSIHFLRGVFSRASMCLPAFYYFLGSASAHETAKTTKDYPFKIAQTYAEFSHLNILTLSCRKVFDHAIKTDLTGANFSKINDSIILEHAEYWSERSGIKTDECLNSLIFLRRFFSEYSKTSNNLLKEDGFLHKRIGLLKQHADRAAAHLSLEDFSIDILDVAHFTAAITIAAEIVRSFDNPSLNLEYFNRVDSAAYQAAKRTFPQIADFQLFNHLQVHQQARSYWKSHHHESIQSCFDQLQWALG